MELKGRIRNALLGLAAGDALGWPSMFHRSWLLPPWTRRIRREMDAGNETTGVIRPPLPFSLNQPAELLDLSPTDDAEWAAFTAGVLLRHGWDPGRLLLAWEELARLGDSVRGGVSTQAALANMRRGLKPPATGRDNPHYMDDGAMPRAVAIGLFFAGSPREAAEKAAFDASITNAEDGVWGAQAIAAAMSVACRAAQADEVVAASLVPLPAQSMIRRRVQSALDLCELSVPAVDLIPGLARITVNEYSYGCTAAETLALTLAVVRLSGGDFRSALFTALSFPRSADTVPALAGALTAALADGDLFSSEWLERLGQLQGICVPTLRGQDFLAVADGLAAVAGDRRRSDANDDQLD